jgi:serine-type D-Ala-D-Ala carboxypeptidase/endopeptidase
VGLAWIISNREGKQIVWHNGGTGGFRSFMGFDPVLGVGVVVLCNTFTMAGCDDIGMHLLNPNIPLMKPPKQRADVSVDYKLFDGYVGRYQLAPNFVITVSREGDRLFVQLTGQPKFEVYAESDRSYFLKVVDAQITFNTDDQGQATEMILHQGGRDQTAQRIE